MGLRLLAVVDEGLPGARAQAGEADVGRVDGLDRRKLGRARKSGRRVGQACPGAVALGVLHAVGGGHMPVKQGVGVGVNWCDGGPSVIGAGQAAVVKAVDHRGQEHALRQGGVLGDDVVAAVDGRQIEQPGQRDQHIVVVGEGAFVPDAVRGDTLGHDRGHAARSRQAGIGPGGVAEFHADGGRGNGTPEVHIVQAAPGVGLKVVGDGQEEAVAPLGLARGRGVGAERMGRLEHAEHGGRFLERLAEHAAVADGCAQGPLAVVVGVEIELGRGRLGHFGVAGDLVEPGGIEGIADVHLSQDGHPRGLVGLLAVGGAGGGFGAVVHPAQGGAGDRVDIVVGQAGNQVGTVAGLAVPVVNGSTLLVEPGRPAGAAGNQLAGVGPVLGGCAHRQQQAAGFEQRVHLGAGQAGGDGGLLAWAGGNDGRGSRCGCRRGRGDGHRRRGRALWGRCGRGGKQAHDGRLGHGGLGGRGLSRRGRCFLGGCRCRGAARCHWRRGRAG
mmetsp:Transcript_6404/g.26211  ORF Transcript_6404/g.26211 Transcript_6404/m.26211 type:complete len:498 (+) Transcript_6404:2535-4028(+)